MKICILSTGRAGSTSLYNAFKLHLSNDYYSITEPFNYDMKRMSPIEENQFDYINNCENVLIKSIITQIPPNMDMDSYYEWTFNFFDYVVLLDRRDEKLQSESFAFLRYTNETDWHLKKKRYNMSKVPKEFLNEIHNGVIRFKKILTDLSVKYKHKIYYYEDIFIEHNRKIIEEIFKGITNKIDEDIITRLIISDHMKVRIDEKVNKLI